MMRQQVAAFAGPMERKLDERDTKPEVVQKTAEVTNL